MFRAHVLIITRSKLHYTASGIITLIGVMIKLIVKQILCIKLVKYWDKYTEMHGQQNVKINSFVYCRAFFYKMCNSALFGPHYSHLARIYYSQLLGLHSSPFDFLLRLQILCCVDGWNIPYIFLNSPFLYRNLAFMYRSRISLCKICFPTFKVTLNHLILTIYVTGGGLNSWPHSYLVTLSSIFFPVGVCNALIL